MTGSPETPEHTLAAEQEYLRQARAHLRAMREHTLSLTAHGGDRVSTEYLKAALHRRARSLADDPSLPLFFGRTDHDAAPGSDDGATETFYIGRRHVMDEAGDPVVVDWRTDIARPFYQATRKEPQGLIRRRRFGSADGQLTSFEDEDLRDTSVPETVSTILTAEIERPRVGPMRDIVATIQPEQDDVVRVPLDRSVCVQGAPGTGKTAVGLHRAAYLLHTYRQRLSRSGVLVVGPNDAFLHYISHVLPTLGEVDVRQVTVPELVGRVPIRGTDSSAAGLLKGDPRMAEVVHRAVWSHLRVPAESLMVPRGSRTWRIPADEIAEAVQALRERGDGYATGRALLPVRLAHRVLLRLESAGEITDDRVQNAVARSRAIRACVDAVWPAIDPIRVVFRLLSDGEFLENASTGILDDHERALLRWSRPARSPASAIWSEADAVLIDEAHGVVERESGVGHVILDEAQDLSPMALRAVGRRAAGGSITVLGDLAQGTTPWAARTWTDTLTHLGQDEAQVEVLQQGYRVPAVVMDVASRLLPTIAPGIAPPETVRSNPGEFAVHAVNDDADDALAHAVVAAVTSYLERDGSVGVLVADDRREEVQGWLTRAGVRVGDLDSGSRTTVVPVGLAKGLEFDHVVLVEPADVVEAHEAGLRWLYVALTRAVSALTVAHVRTLPAELATPART